MDENDIRLKALEEKNARALESRLALTAQDKAVAAAEAARSHGAAALLAAGVLRISENDEKYLAAAVVSAVILFLGNLAPKLPRTRHTGLRLPWTVADEDAWICAHRAVGYISFPLVCFYAAGVLATGQIETLTGLAILLWVGVPGALSYRVYRQKFPKK